jgi:glycosyltransferase involved in cell wall biosynthesis
MKLLHLMADWKWTGPCEPTLDLLAELRDRGHDVTLICAEAEDTSNRTLPDEARKAGVPLGPPLRFKKNLRLVSNFKDARTLARYMDEQRFDIIHCHQSLDHWLAVAALKMSKARPPLVRTNHRSAPLGSGLGLAAIFSFSSTFHEADRKRVPHAFLIQPALRLEKYPSNLPSKRDSFGFTPDHFVVGMVLRVQKHRKIDVALEALRMAHAKASNLRALIVGRGTHREKLAIKPVEKMGLKDVILFTGYVKEGYLETLASFDALLFPRPGSDGTARALREVLVLGKPAVVTKAGMLPEIVRNGETGYVVPLDPVAISEKLTAWARRPEEARKMGATASQNARDRFDLKRQARDVEEAYEKILGS